MRFLTLSVAFALIFLSSSPAAQSDPAQVAFGARHAIALRMNGDMCQLGRRAGNGNAEPGLVLRNGVHVAAAAEHSMAVTRDGHVYGWGMNGKASSA